MQDFIKIHEKDNVVVALRPIGQGEKIAVLEGGGAVLEAEGMDGQGSLPGEGMGGQGCLREITALDAIPAGHKMAVCDIPSGSEVIKYGYRIGNTKEAVQAGNWVHTHNLKTALGDLLEYTYEPVFGGEKKHTGEADFGGETAKQCGKQRENSPKTGPVSFMGFQRLDGRVGVRNEIWIIPTVGCVNNVASSIARQANAFRKGTVEEVIAFPHPYGCSQMGEDQEDTRRILADLVNHPNAGGVLVLGLGCENSNIEVLKPYIGPFDEKRVRFLVAQEWEDEVEAALEIVRELIDYASVIEREPIGADKLIVGMKCGGSDGLSGITANPLVGRFSDRLIAEGGTTILTEVPEMFGAETILMNRCENEALFCQTVDLINDFKQYFKRHGQTIYENPSPGNKEGGISTLEDKSLGCTQKSGSAPVRGVLSYGERVQNPGLNLLSAPGNDLVASTALAAAGAQIVLFTTGRGTPFASPVPTVKISTNSVLAGRKANWIDFNAGRLVEDTGLEEEAERLFDYVMEVASGRKVCSEAAGYHDMAIFKQGVTL